MYCRVIDGKVILGPIELPWQWVNPMTKEIHYLSLLSDDELFSIGWYPLILDTTILNPDYENITEIVYLVNSHNVSEIVTIGRVSIDDAKEIKVSIIKVLIDDILSNTFIWNGDTWQGDEEARLNISGLTTAIANGVSLPSGFTWRNSVGQSIVMSEADMVALGATLLVWMNTAFQVSFYHIGMVMSLTDIEQIVAYDHTVGWPT